VEYLVALEGNFRDVTRSELIEAGAINENQFLMTYEINNKNCALILEYNRSYVLQIGKHRFCKMMFRRKSD
jgi:hypothetical protein